MVTDTQKFQKFWNSLSVAQRNNLMRDVFSDIAQQQQLDERQHYLSEDGIVRFCQDKVVIELAGYQERILRALVRYRRVSVRGPHGLGKTTVAALFVLWLMFVCDDVKIPTLAPTHRQTGFIWSEIRKRARAIPDKDYRVLQRALKGRDKEAFAVASDDPQLIEGVHAQCVAYVFDESKAIADEFWNSAEGAFSNAGDDTDFDSYWLSIGTPFITEGVFYEIHSGKPGFRDWHTIHVTIEECLAAGRISSQWVEKRKEQWGEDSPIYKNRVLGEFAEQAENAIIPFAWLEAAHERFYQLKKEAGPVARKAFGVDPADGGPDKSAIAEKIGRVIRLEYHKQKDTMALSGYIAAKLGNQKAIPLAVDVIGIGAGVGSRLAELGFNVEKVNVGAAAKDKNGNVLKDTHTQTFEFVNLRSWVWWHIRDMLNPANPEAIALNPDDDLLTGDLLSVSYSYRSDGKIQVEPKADVRKRLKRSTDAGDALGLVLYADFLASYRATQNFQYHKAVWRYDPGRKDNFADSRRNKKVKSFPSG